VPVHGGPPRALIAGPASDYLPLRTPEGTRVFFTSDRSGSTSGWLVDVAGGVASGEPRQIVKDFGGAEPIAFARDGSLFYFLDVSDIDVYALAIARDAPVAGAKPRRVAPTMAGRHSHASWSPDGRFLAYLTFWPVDTVALTIQTIATGGERHIPMPLRISKGYPLAPQWAPDGGSVALRGAGASDRRGFFLMGIATGRVTPLLMFDPLGDESRYRHFEWTPDGRAFNYRTGSRKVVRRDLQTGRETLVTDGVTGYFSSSPDGRLVAVQRVGALWVIGPGASRREVVKPAAPEGLALQGWTSDGRRLLYTTFTPKANPDSQAAPSLVSRGGWRNADRHEGVDSGLHPGLPAGLRARSATAGVYPVRRPRVRGALGHASLPPAADADATRGTEQVKWRP
jgi:Tol biopolymer transport system component